MKSKMNIGIIGGGNIGTALAIELTHKNYKVFLHSSKAKQFSKKLCLEDLDNQSIIYETLHMITENLSELCEACSIIIVTLPSNLWKAFAQELVKYIQKGTMLLILPGIGGAEYVFNECINKGVVLIGLQRVPAVYRLKKPCEIATISGRRKGGLFVCSIPRISSEKLGNIIYQLFGMTTTVLPNYLNVTLTPSNPLLHTSRLYSLFHSFDAKHIFSRNPLFYGEWDISSSIKLIQCDHELQLLKEKIFLLDLTEVKSLLVHYESTDEKSLTTKISSIKSLHNLESPMIKTKEGFIIDWNSRYFKADFPNGIVIIKAIAMLFSFSTPAIDEIIFWYQKMVNKEFFIDHKTFGADIKECNIPQNYGINSIEDFIRYYQ